MGALTSPAEPQKRRSDRIFIRIPLAIRGTDQNGQDFGNRAVTETVARFGASIVTKYSLSPEQELTLIPAAKKPIRARVIGQTSIGPDGHVYGIAFVNSTSDHWGIHFPPLADAVSPDTQLECWNCHVRESVPLNELEVEVFRANDRLRRFCSQCGGVMTWGLAEPVPTRKPPRPHRDLTPDGEKPDLGLRSETPPSELISAPATQPKRKYPRVRVTVKACIAQPGSDNEVTTTINMGRGGILVSSDRMYPIESWIQLAVPYIPAAANIFVAARIVWRADFQGAYRYGIKYVRN